MRCFLFLFTAFLLFSCKEDTIATFQGENGLNFWGNGSSTAIFTTQQVYSFSSTANQNKADDSVFFDLQVSGKTTDYPRMIKIKAVDGSTARVGVDYDFPSEVALPAGAYRVRYPVYIYNTAALQRDTLTLVLEPVATSDFIIGATGPIPPPCSTCGTPTVWLYSNASLIVSNILPRPSTWSDAVFGAFSSVKLRFMMQVTGLSNFATTVIGSQGVINIPIQLRQALATYEALNGPLLDENNNRVTF